MLTPDQHAAGQMPLDGRAVGDVQPPRAGLAEADGTIPLAVLDQEFRIDVLKDFHARLDGVEPLVELGFAVAESGLHEEADKGFAGVVGSSVPSAAMKWSLPPPRQPELSSRPCPTMSTSASSSAARRAAPTPEAPVPRMSTSVLMRFPKLFL